MKYRAIWLGSIAALCVAVLPMPYGYYQLLRVAICSTATFIAIQEQRSAETGWMWAFIACALAYNPVSPLALGRTLWTIANVVAVLLFLIHYRTRVRHAL